MGYYDQPTPIERTLELECEGDGDEVDCEQVAEYDVQIDGGVFEWTCEKCGTEHTVSDWYEEPDADAANDLRFDR